MGLAQRAALWYEGCCEVDALSSRGTGDAQGKKRPIPQRYQEIIDYLDENPEAIIMLEGDEGKYTYTWFRRHKDLGIKVVSRGSAWYIARDTDTE